MKIRKIFCATAGWMIALTVVGAENAPSLVRVTPTVKAVAKAMPGVVNLSTEKVIEAPESGKFTEAMFTRQTGYSLGSGSIIDPSGLIVTNAHVVRRAIKINITLSDGKRYRGRIIAENDLNDIALIKIIGQADSQSFKTVKMARPDDLMLGETVIVVGNPYGLGSSITKGVLSATSRKVTYQGKVLFKDLIQTDAPVYPGSSGGPLINLAGDMIGITTATLRQTQGIAFAIPLERIENILARWLIPERFNDVSLGIIPAVTIKADGQPFFFLADVIEGSPAWTAGLRAGMEIKQIDGEKIDSLIKLSRKLWKIKFGEAVKVACANNRSYRIVAAKISPEDGLHMAVTRLGLKLYPLTAKLAKALHYPFRGGLVISDYYNNGGAKPARGDILYQLGDVTINSQDDIVSALRNSHYDDRIKAVVISVRKRNDKYYLLKKNISFRVR
ncbi:MAG: S1C family serine protease [Victivallaceae bacterium]|nr:S1C family serine protease [Victivallaceae bacterium]